MTRKHPELLVVATTFLSVCVMAGLSLVDETPTSLGAMMEAN